MIKVFTLAKTTLQEMLREKVFSIVLLIAIALIALSFLLGALSLAEQRKILADFGFLGMEIGLLGVSLFSGSYLISKEIEKQTCLLILSRPVSRSQFIMGKVFGVVALNTLLLISLGLVLGGLLRVWSDANTLLAYFKICLSLWFESAVVLGWVICLSLVVRPVLALGGGGIVFLLGHWLGDLTFFAQKSKDELFILGVRLFHWVTPNFYKLNWKSSYFLDAGVPTQNFLWMLAHMTGWMILLVLIANFLFRRKDIV